MASSNSHDNQNLKGHKVRAQSKRTHSTTGGISWEGDILFIYLFQNETKETGKE
jgi:hypothetical protein